jgi:Copper amine oxidase N-terminal domain
MNGRSFLVIRYITEELSAEISWDGSEKKVTIETKDGKIIELWIGKANAKIDGEDVFIDEDDHSIVPYISEGRTLLPLRFVSNTLGAEDVLWDGETKKITLIWMSAKSVKHNIQLTIDETSNLTGFDVLGNNYILETVSENTDLEPGDKIISNYVISDLKKRAGSLAGILTLKNINRADSTNSVIGMVISNTTDTTPCKIVISSGDNELEFLYEFGLDGLECVKSDSWIKITSTGENEVSGWEYLRNELHEGLEAHSTEFFYEKQIASQQTIIISTEDVLTDDPTPCKVSFISNDLDTLKTGACYLLSYKTNWLGRNIVTSIEELNCQCMMILPEINLRERSIYGGEKKEYKFTLTNNSRVRKDFECFTFCSSEDGFPGNLRLIKNNISLNPGSSESLTFMLEAEKNAEGSFEIVYGAKCDDVEIKHSITFEVLPNSLDYEVIMPERIYCPDNLRKFTIPVKIINNSSEAVELVLEATQNTQEKFSFSPKDIYLEGNSTKEIIVSVSLPPNPRDHDKERGDRFTFSLTVKDFIKKHRFSTAVYIDIAKHPIVDTTISLDKNTDTVTLNTSIDWLLFKPGYVNIDWGDGTTTNKAESFPYKHKYTSSGCFQY